MAKSDIGLGGFTLKAMGTKYKAILVDVDAYHARINSTKVDPINVRSDVGLLDEFLERIQIGCTKYLQDHDERDERATWIEDLGAKVGVERQVIAGLAGQAGVLAGRRWADVLPKAGGASGGLDIPANDVAEHQQDPGLEGSVVKAGTIQPVLDPLTGLGGASTLLPKGAKVIIHRTDNPLFVRVETYQATGKLNTFAVQGTGYTLAANVKNGSVVHKKLADDVPIFTREPHPDDVNQGGLGDCYLVAALAAIAATTPSQIYDMMKDNGNGTVTVRLYSVVPPPGATAKYLTISKSVISDDRKSSGAMWVPLLEKAYAALGQGTTAGIVTTQSKSYAQVGDGGHSDTSFQILTGRPVQVRTDISSTLLDSSPMWGVGQVANAEKKGIDKTAAFQRIYDGDVEKTRKFIVFAKRHGEAMNKFRTYEQFDSLIKKEGLDAEVAGPLLKDVQRQVPGRRGTGLYTKTQTDLFDRIHHELTTGGFVAAGTPKKIVLEKGGAKGKGHSGGEETGEGLVGQHAYSVMAAREVAKDGVPTRKYIRVRNPWGDDSVVEGRGRVYKELQDGTLDIETDPATLKAKSKSEFDMELSDFTKNFEKMYWG